MNEAVTDDETRVRYGFVPYSMTVNARELVSSGSMPTSYFRDTAPYESREAQFNTPVFVGTTSTELGVSYETYKDDIKDWQCDKYANNDYPNNGDNPKTISGSAPGKVREETYSFHSWVGSGSKRTCTRKVVESETTYETKFAFSNWRYKEVELDTSVFKTGASVSVGTSVVDADHHDIIDPAVHTYADQAGYYDMVTLAKKNGSILHNVGLTDMVWNGCIEERDTVDDEDWSPIPSGAYDLDIDMIPNSEETRWRPMWEKLVYYRDHHQHVDTEDDYSNAYSKCPSSMKLFTEVELSSDPEDVPEWLENYLDALVPTG
ncbi:MAG: hypothetical protein R3D89_14460, partial [Sphingomonadaceae bacterium]